MRYRELRRILQQIVIAGIPVAAAGCGETDCVAGLPAAAGGCGEDDCVSTIEHTYTIQTPADLPLQFQIDRCRVDVDACNDLCQEMLQRNNVVHMHSTCDVSFKSASVVVSVAYQIDNGNSGCPVAGRRPAGLLAPDRLDARSAAGAWLARAAWLEAASIHAFVRLAGELAQHGAPPALVRWALLSARDEVRHTAAMSRLAACHGAVSPVPAVAPLQPRSLEALAIENAAEGCVRETWGAVIAEWQSRAALDPEVRAVFAGIARDETRHAALAWAVDRWVRPRLDPAACARVDAALEAAARELAASADLSSPMLGLPAGPQVRGLYARALESIWNLAGPPPRRLGTGAAQRWNGGRTCHA